MLFVPITSLDMLSQIPPQADGVELRLDLFAQMDMEKLASLAASSKLPLLFTLRKASQGGQFKGSEKEREQWIEKLLKFEPAYFDLENDMDPNFLEKVCKRQGNTRIIISYHNFQEIPENIEAIYHAMSQFPADGYKIAAHAKSTNDALRLLLFGRQHPKASVIAMGENGEFARIIGRVCGNLFDYASLNQEQKTAPGQLTASELIEIYDYQRLNSKTHLYGLIGDPISKSQGHLYHNAHYRQHKLDSVYVKMIVKPEELSTFFPLALEMGFRGLSVTMPLKEKVLPFLHFIDPIANKIGAVNTVVIKNGQLSGYNTDAAGALDALEKKGSVRGKKMVLIGAGGAARAIAFEGHRRGAQIVILNRTLQKAQELATEVEGQAGDLSQVPAKYDILVNCAPDSALVDLNIILPTAIVMDIVHTPMETPLLQKALQLGCQVVYGKEMFYNQAVAQIQLGLGQ